MKRNTDRAAAGHHGICLLNDSFPPVIDGVANAVLNYARELDIAGTETIVVTPDHPQARDSQYPFPVIRYPSVAFRRMDGYVAGIPFSPDAAREVSSRSPALLHTHCPIISTFMARELRQILRTPIVLTYHTKFDVDIDNLIKNEPLQLACRRALAENISACDEVWTVSHGAGENMRALGYEGDYIVMPNGVDLPQERLSEEKVAAVGKEYDLPPGIPVYLFVGRLMWYKGIRIILDALQQLQSNGRDFRMVFVGDGADRGEIEAYVKKLSLADRCVFTGAIRDREALRGWYCRADLFLFPSSFDTNGLVVREAAACELPAVLLRNSCAAEGVTDGRNGFLIDETAESLSGCLVRLYGQREMLRQVGCRAGSELYLSWKDAVGRASRRYQLVMERHQSGCYPRRLRPVEGIMKFNGELMDSLAKLSEWRRSR